MKAKPHKSPSPAALARRPKGYDEQEDAERREAIEYRRRAMEACTPDAPCLYEECPRCADWHACQADPTRW